MIISFHCFKLSPFFFFSFQTFSALFCPSSFCRRQSGENNIKEVCVGLKESAFAFDLVPLLRLSPLDNSLTLCPFVTLWVCLPGYPSTHDRALLLCGKGNWVTTDQSHSNNRCLSVLPNICRLSRFEIWFRVNVKGFLNHQSNFGSHCLLVFQRGQIHFRRKGIANQNNNIEIRVS